MPGQRALATQGLSPTACALQADTMTIHEAAAYRNDVITKLANPMVPGVCVDDLVLWHQCLCVMIQSSCGTGV